MKRFKVLAIGLICLAPVAGCSYLPGGNLGSGPYAISPAGIKVSPLQNDRVHLTISPETASIGLPKLYVRVARGAEVLVRESYDWNYKKGVEADLGSAEVPLKAGDKVQVGTSDVNTHVEVIVSP